MNKFVKDHIIQIHFQYLSQNHRSYLPPLDRFLRSYLTKHKSIGSSERSIISEKIFSLIRQMVFLTLQYRYEHLLGYMTKTTPFKMTEEPTTKKPHLSGAQYHQKQKQIAEQKPTKRQEQIIQAKLQLLNKNEIYSVIDNQKLPKWLRTSSNKLMFKELSMSLIDQNDIIGERKTIRDGKEILQLGNQDEAFRILQIMNTRAPLTLRVNPLKISLNPLKFMSIN